MDRRSLFRMTPAILGATAVGGLSMTPAAAEPSSESGYIRSVADILNISYEEAADLWSVKENREILPVGSDLYGRHSLVSSPDSGIDASTKAAATNSYTGIKTFKNLYGQKLMSVTVKKTVVTMSAPVQPVSAYVETHSTTTLGRAAWVAQGPTSAYNIDERRNPSHFSRRAATWTARGRVQGRVALGVGILAKVGNLYSVTGYKW